MNKNYRLIVRLAATGLLVLLLLAGGFGRSTAITYGQPDTTNRFSNVGSIVISLPGEGNFQFCSGTLIGDRELLTAGHCTFILSNNIAAGNFELSNVKVSFDPLDGTSPVSFWDVESLHTHPDLKLTTANAFADIGVIVLTQSPNLPRAQLAPVGYLEQLKSQGHLRNMKVPSSFIMVGYGAQLDWPPPQVTDSEKGRFYTLPEFQSLTSKWLHVNQNPVVGNGGICFGDSGGPTFWTTPEGNQVLVGVNSWVGAVHCNSNGYSYRVDLPEIRAFIEAMLNQN